MAAQTEKAAIAFTHFGLPLNGQISARTNQRGRSAMLQTAITITDRQRHEYITWHRRFFCHWLKEGNLRFADFSQVGTQARLIEIRHTPTNDHVMRHAMRTKMHELKLTHFDRMINQLIIIFRDIAAKAIAARL